MAWDCKGKASTPQKKNIRELHAYLQTLTAEEAKELAGLQKPDEEKKDFWKGELFRRQYPLPYLSHIC